MSAAQCNGDEVVGGTSAAAPLWTGVGALINQALAKQNKPALGNANDALLRSPMIRAPAVISTI